MLIIELPNGDLSIPQILYIEDQILGTKSIL